MPHTHVLQQARQAERTSSRNTTNRVQTPMSDRRNGHEVRSKHSERHREHHRKVYLLDCSFIWTFAVGRLGLRRLASAQDSWKPQAQSVVFFATTTVAGSPAWHRHRRRLRSRARWKARRGLSLTRRQLDLLRFHHGTTPSQRYALDCRMGKKDNWKSKAAWQGKPWDGSPGWSRYFWSTAKKMRDQGSWSWQSQAPQFPAYDAGWDRPQEIVEIASSSTRPRPDNIVKQVQEAINTVRKADNKVSKLKADQHSKKQCWTAYVQNMQQAFTTERRKHVAAMEKLTQDLEEAKALQLSSREGPSHRRLLARPSPLHR